MTPVTLELTLVGIFDDPGNTEILYFNRAYLQDSLSATDPRHDTLIAVAAVVRRFSALALPSSSGPPQLVEMDRVFASHAALTLAHILPALAFVLIAPFAVFHGFSRFTWPEPWLFPLGVVVGMTAYAISTYAVGGWTKRSAVLFFNSVFLFSLQAPGNIEFVASQY